MPSHFTIRSPIMTDAVWCTPTCGITYYNSVSHHDGCRLVHPDTWYHLFGLPSCRMPWCMWYHLFGLPSCWMPFGAPRHVVSLIRSPIMPDAVCAPRNVVSLIRSPIMPDVVWCTPTCGITYSVSHHAGCRLVHPDTWYQLNVIRHHDGSSW